MGSQIDEADIQKRTKQILAIFWMGVAGCLVAVMLGDFVAVYNAWKMLLFQYKDLNISPAQQTVAVLFFFSAGLSMVSLSGLGVLKYQVWLYKKPESRSQNHQST